MRNGTAHRWDPTTLSGTGRRLTMLVAWLGVNAPLLEADVRAVCALHPQAAARSIVQFLQARGMLLRLPRADGEEEMVSRLVTALPGNGRSCSGR